MKKKIDLTSWYEVIDYIASNSENKKEKTKDLILKLKEDMIKQMNLLWNKEELNNIYLDDKEQSDKLKEYLDFKNIFYKNAIVDKEDYFLTRYELKEKYGKDWFDKNHYGNFIGPKRNLSIDQFELLTSLIKKRYYGFWSYEIDKDASIHPKFHQYNLSELSEYIKDKNIFGNFEVEINEQKSKNIMKM